jgi:hypothetical protein
MHEHLIERKACSATTIILQVIVFVNPALKILAGAPGFEPELLVLETNVLPLHHAPTK